MIQIFLLLLGPDREMEPEDEGEDGDDNELNEKKGVEKQEAEEEEENHVTLEPEKKFGKSIF